LLNKDLAAERRKISGRNQKFVFVQNIELVEEIKVFMSVVLAMGLQVEDGLKEG